jgi:hypothetical protein
MLRKLVRRREAFRRRKECVEIATLQQFPFKITACIFLVF